MRSSTDAVKPPRRIQMENSVAVTVDAGIDEVWNVVRDVTRVGEWSHECVGAAWLGDATSAVPGARFRGRNRAGIIRWGRVCEILSAEPHELVWRTVPTALYPDSSEWRITLDEVDDGTRISQRFRVLRAPKVLGVIYAMLIPTHRDRTAALMDDLRRLSGCRHPQMEGEVMRTRSDLDITELRSALAAATERTGQLIRSASETSTRVPGLTWTVGETAAHLVGGISGYAGFVDGSRDAGADLAGMPGANTPAERGDIMSARILQEITERDGDHLADLLASAVTGYLTAVDGHRGDEPILTWLGVAMTVPVMTSAMLGELLLHGWDIARATGARPTIARHEALLVIAGIMALIPEYVDREKTRGLHITYELRFRGGRRYVIAIDNGTAQIDPPGARVDCWISVDPAAFLLVGYGRVNQWSQTLRGRMLSGGRKPWLGLRFGELVGKV